MKKREPVLIANRGEIAIRIARTARALGFPIIAIYSEADRFSEHVRLSQKAYCVGPAAPSESYLNVDRIIDVARKTGARYVHPGYGFLSERAHFVKACEKAGLIFVGPSAENIDVMGDKIRARDTVDRIQVPRVPGSAGAVPSAEEAARVASEIGYPVLLKAAAGGGGKGMRRVDHEKEIKAAFEGASREAQSAFGDGSMYVEKFILEPHHVEIQVFGDGKGGAIHLGERECSIQRRHQKVWEESPSPILNQYPKTREAMFEAAVKVTSHIKYAGAGTLEFIVDGKGNFYFLEMNTRLQVEHPVTEWVTGVDLVAWQLLLAAGELKLPQVPPRRGSSIEVRLYAEDPQTFLPAPGLIGDIFLPSGAFVRSDAAVTGPCEVSPYYDPMIAKVSVWGDTREEAVGRLRVALDEAKIEPPRKKDGMPVGSMKTNLPFLRKLVRNGDVIKGNTTTDLIPSNPDLTADTPEELTPEAAVAVSLFQLLMESEQVLAGIVSDDSVIGGGALTGKSQKKIQPHSRWTDLAKREGVRLP